MTKTHSLNFALIIFACFSCTPLYMVNRSFISIDAQKPKYDRSLQVEVYFTGEQTNFEYEKLGIVEVKASNIVDKSHLFSHLKYEAWRQGADAIISVTKDDKTQVYTTYNSSTKRSSTHTVNIPFIQGIAVKKINKNENYGAFGFEKVDTSFISVVRQDIKIQEKSMKSNSRGWLIYLGLLLALMLTPIFIVFFVILPNSRQP
jgi:hypothetical protein